MSVQSDDAMLISRSATNLMRPPTDRAHRSCGPQRRRTRRRPPTLFNALNPPSIITHQGAVEDWTIENQAMENHEFHMHPIHFLVLEQNNEAAIAVDQGQFLDMLQVPFWSRTGPFPCVKVRMDFRGMDVGDFVLSHSRT